MQRRRAHELEVLRDLGKMLGETWFGFDEDDKRVMPIAFTLLTLRMDRGDLPMMQAALYVGGSSDAFDRKYPGIGSSLSRRFVHIHKDGIGMAGRLQADI